MTYASKTNRKGVCRRLLSRVGDGTSDVSRARSHCSNAYRHHAKVGISTSFLSKGKGAKKGGNTDKVSSRRCFAGRPLDSAAPPPAPPPRTLAADVVARNDRFVGETDVFGASEPALFARSTPPPIVVKVGSPSCGRERGFPSAGQADSRRGVNWGFESVGPSMRTSGTVAKVGGAGGVPSSSTPASDGLPSSAGSNSSSSSSSSLFRRCRRFLFLGACSVRLDPRFVFVWRSCNILRSATGVPEICMRQAFGRGRKRAVSGEEKSSMSQSGPVLRAGASAQSHQQRIRACPRQSLTHRLARWSQSRDETSVATIVFGNTSTKPCSSWLLVRCKSRVRSVF